MATTTRYENANGDVLTVTKFTAQGNVRSGDARTNYRINGKKVAKAIGVAFLQTAKEA